MRYLLAEQEWQTRVGAKQMTTFPLPRTITLSIAAAALSLVSSPNTALHRFQLTLGQPSFWTPEEGCSTVIRCCGLQELNISAP